MIMPYKDLGKKRENHKRYMKEVWYPLNKQKHIKYVSNLKKKISEYVLGYKINGKCYDCGLKGDKYPEVLEFDHKMDKKFNISEYERSTSSIKRVMEEMLKCDLVCANCHRIRTANRRKILSA